jgi:CelD/BcsL family acetyltransferase involved in cellulose biosynthesis
MNEGTDIMEGMLKDRRDWINEYRQSHMNKIPEDIKPFYDRFNVEAPLSPEEEEAKRLAEEEAAGKKKKKTEKKKEKKKKGKKKKDDDDGVAIIKIGASEVVQKFDEQYEDYTETWVNRDETENYKQTYDVELAK